MISICLVALMMTGCATAVFVPNGKAVRNAKPIKCKVYVKCDDGKERLVTMEIPAGWYMLPKE